MRIFFAPVVRDRICLEELFVFQDQLKRATGSLDNPSERTQHKRDLARILTVLGEKTRTEKKA